MLCVCTPGEGGAGLWPPARPTRVSAEREQLQCQSVSGLELGAEASFLSLSCRWGLLQAWRGPSCLSSPPPETSQIGTF